MVMVWGEEMDTQEQEMWWSPKQRMTRVDKKKKNDLSSKKIHQKKVFSFLWSPWESTVLPLPEESEARPFDQKYTAIRFT